MKFRSLRKWDDLPSSRGLIFVAQIIDELLFEFTLDTYKPSAMNTCLLVLEAVSTIKAIDAGTIMRPNLRHILDELCVNLEKDEVARSLVSVDLSGVASVLKNKRATNSSISTTVDLLMSQIPLSRYKLKNEELLVNEVVGRQDFSSLRSLARSYITTLLNAGYSAKFIQKVSQSFFFYSSDRISGNSAILEYVKIFSNDVVEYKVLYRAPGYLKEFFASGRQLGIEIVDSVNELESQVDRFGFELTPHEVYLLKKVKSKDPYSAKSKADQAIELLQTLIGLYHHKESPKPIVECLVVDSNSGDCIKVVKSVNPMHKCHDAITAVASKRLASFMEGFSMRNDSFRKFNRSAELHALALSSESTENQMINLWIALESLIPNKDDAQDISQIEHVTGSILPFLNLCYVNKVVLRFAKDLLYWNSRLTKGILKNIEGVGILRKTTHLLALPEYQSYRERLEASFGNYHLLHDRYLYIKYVLSSPQNVVSVLDGHKIRVEWQIRRIYRARNMIVHDGVTPSYTDVLIENTHDYLDTVMRGLMALASSGNTLDAIDQGFKMVELNYSSYYGALSAKGAGFTKENIDGFLFKHPI